MSSKLDAAIRKFTAIVREETSSCTTKFCLTVTASGNLTDISEQTPEQLRYAGISMRNLRGEWIEAAPADEEPT